MVLTNSISFDEYLQIDAINASIIKCGRKSMLAMRHAQLHSVEPTTSMAFGTLVHMMLLEQERFADEVVVYDGVKRGKDWESFSLANEKNTIVSRDLFNSLVSVEKSVSANNTALSLLSGSGKNELTLTWDDPIYGSAKARFDRWKDDTIIDIKTCADLSTFNAQFVRMGYDVQFGWYREGAEKALGKKHAKAIVIAIENKEPFDVAVFAVPESAIQKGREDAIRIASDFNSCKDAGVYPGAFADALNIMQMPAWYEGPSDADLDAYGIADPREL